MKRCLLRSASGLRPAGTGADAHLTASILGGTHSLNSADKDETFGSGDVAITGRDNRLRGRGLRQLPSRWRPALSAPRLLATVAAGPAALA